MTPDEQAIFDGVVKQRDVLRAENRELYLRAQELESQLKERVSLSPSIVIERDFALQERDEAWAEIHRLTHALHSAEGTAKLAIRHRDHAEKTIADIKAANINEFGLVADSKIDSIIRAAAVVGEWP